MKEEDFLKKFRADLKNRMSLISNQEDNVDIFEDRDTVYDPATAQSITKSKDVIRQEKEKVRDQRYEDIVHDASIALNDSAAFLAREIAWPISWATKVINFGSRIVDGPEIPDIQLLGDFIDQINQEEYKARDGGWAWWGASGATTLIGTGLLYDKALDKIQSAYPKLYTKLRRWFPYSVGQIHGAFKEAVTNTKEAGKAIKKGTEPIKKIAKIAGDLVRRTWPGPEVRGAMGVNSAKLLRFGTGAGLITGIMTSKPTGGEGAMSDQPSERIKDLAAKKFSEQFGLNITADMIDFFDPSPNLDASDDSPVVYINHPEVTQAAHDAGINLPTLNQWDLEEELGLYTHPDDWMTDEESIAYAKKIGDEIQAEKDRRSTLGLRRKTGEWFKDFEQGMGEWLGDTKIGKKIKKGLEYIETGEDEKETVYDIFAETTEGQAEDQADKAENERYMNEKRLIQQAPFVDSFNPNDYKESYLMLMQNREPNVPREIQEQEFFNFFNVDPNSEEYNNNKNRLLKLLSNMPDGGKYTANVDVTLPANQMAYGGQPGQFTDSMITGLEEDIDIQDFNLEPAYEGIDDLESLFEEANLKPTQKSDLPPEVQVASLGKIFGKVPIWAIANIDKFKMLVQNLTNKEKKLLDDISSKLEIEKTKKKKIYEEDTTETIDDVDIVENVAGEASDTAIETIKRKKTIIDSPEESESMFYSNIEAKLMDPNTPKTFSNVEEFFNFLKRKGISKAEVDDYILNNYLDLATKNKFILNTDDMLKIVRQAPMRNIDYIIYGDSAYGGSKKAVYEGSHMESGYIPNSYREEVLFLDPKYIPQDPDQLPKSGHDFSERYVIGWTRNSDRQGTLPIDDTKKGIEEAIDPEMIKTLKTNQKKLDRQLKGLETSAIRKLEREGLVDIDDVDNLTMAEIRNILDTDTMARLRSIDEPLEQQILQFRMKIDSDGAKLQAMEAATTGQKVIVNFADEIQSDVLQQAKELENTLRKELGDILDLPANERMKVLLTQRAGYTGTARNVEPQVLEFYTKNESVFRPMFNTAEDMQQFINEFRANKKVFEKIAKEGPSPSDESMKQMKIALDKEIKMLEQLDVGLTENSLKQLYPNLPFKNRSEWGDALVKLNLTNAAKRLFVDKVDNAATWYAISPAKLINERYWKGQNYGGTHTPFDQRTKDMKGIGTEEFYGGPDSKSTTLDKEGNPKHFTSVLEKSLKRAAKENNSEVKEITLDGIGKVYAIKITPEMLLPHKTHRNKGGMVYTPELIDIFEVA